MLVILLRSDGFGVLERLKISICQILINGLANYQWIPSMDKMIINGLLPWIAKMAIDDNLS
jgi:hypothetical protein